MKVLDLFGLEGKTALVTGAAQGLGQAMAIALAEAGADVACLDYKPCEETIAAIETLGCKSVMVLCDLKETRVSELENTLTKVYEAFGRLDILVNNAGITRPNSAVDIRELDFDDELEINQKKLFFLTQIVGRQMIARGSGKIINVASTTSFNAGVRVASYVGTKGAVAGYTRAFAAEWAALGVNVNAIAPGFMKTANTTNLLEVPEVYQETLRNIPAKRWGTPADLRGTVVFLASAASDYLHGVIIPVDGGLLIL